MRLENDRVRLRLFEARDIPDRVRWINDPAIHEFLDKHLPISEDKTRRWFDRVVLDDSQAHFVIEEVATGQAVGLCALASSSTDARWQRAELSIYLGEVAAQGKGLAKAALQLLLDYAFSHLHLHRVYLHTAVENDRAHGLFESLGFVREGRLREETWRNGKWCDRYIYSILSNEFVGGTDVP